MRDLTNTDNWLSKPEVLIEATKSIYKLSFQAPLYLALIRSNLPTLSRYFSRKYVVTTIDKLFYGVIVNLCCNRTLTFGAMSKGSLARSLYMRRLTLFGLYEPYR